VTQANRPWHGPAWLQTPFVAVPYTLLRNWNELELSVEDLIVVLEIIAAGQVEGKEFLTQQELGQRCHLDPLKVGECIGRLLEKSLISMGERLEPKEGTVATFFDVSPLWDKLSQPEEVPDLAVNNEESTSGTDAFSLFEREFGRPLSGFEYDQIQQWLREDEHPQWMVIEALKEAVFANKCSIRYIDRILYDWQRHQVRSRRDLETYQESYRERQRAREQVAATRGNRGNNGRKPGKPDVGNSKDERYSAFYQLFPDA
jgi:DNA replication protein